MKKYWVIVTSHDHALSGEKQEIVQVNHGKEGPLKRMSSGDTILLYAPQMIYGEKTLCRRFVAIAELMDDKIIQINVADNFAPYRRKVTYNKITEVDIKPLIINWNLSRIKKAGVIHLDLVFLKLTNMISN